MSTQKASKLMTIIVPCYNIEPYIRSCLHSILSQSIIDRCQVLCIDDGCTDGTEKHLVRYAKKNPNIITVLDKRNKYGVKNTGVSEARNLGLNYTLGQTVMFVDGDDIIGGRPESMHLIDKYYLEKFYDTMMSHPDTSMVVGNMDYCNRIGKEVVATKRFDLLNAQLKDMRTKGPMRYDQALDFLDYRISACNTLYRTDIINTDSPERDLRFVPNMMYFEDVYFVMKYAFRAIDYKYPQLFVPTEHDALYLYRKRPHSAMYKLSSNHSESPMRCLERTKKRMLYYSYLLEESEKHFGIESRIYNIAAHRYANKTTKDIMEYSKTANQPEYNSLLNDYIPEQCSHDCNNHNCGDCAYQYELKYKCKELMGRSK